MESSQNQKLKQELELHPWFTAARCALMYDKETSLLFTFRTATPRMLRPVDVDILRKETEGEIINRFLDSGDWKIVADEEGEEKEVRTEAELTGDEDIVSEEIAEIYASQGLTEEAVQAFEKLSLLFPEKSVYFAGRISEIKNEKR